MSINKITCWKICYEPFFKYLVLDCYFISPQLLMLLCPTENLTLQWCWRQHHLPAATPHLSVSISVHVCHIPSQG